MSTNSKIFLGVVAGFCVLCLCVAGFTAVSLGVAGTMFARNVTIETGPVAVAEASSGIAEYDIPAGFTQQFSLSTFGFSMVALNGSDNHSHIFLMQMPRNMDVNDVDLNQLLSESVASQGYGSWRNGIQWRSAGQTQTVIRGQQVTMYLNEGLNHDGDRYRQMVGVFQGRDGQALLSIERPIAGWDQAQIDSFIQSIK